MAENKAKNLFEKISAIRSIVEAMRKNASGYGYKYVSEDEILANVTAGLKKYNLDVYPRIVPGTMTVTPYTTNKVKFTKDGTKYDDISNEVLVNAEMEFEWVNLDDTSERLVIPWFVVGQQSDASQAFGSGLTYCTRYFFLKFFKASTLEDDPDSWRTKQKDAMNSENKEIAQAILDQVDEICRNNTNDENKAKLTELLKGIIKKNGRASADYMSVTDPETASSVLNAVKDFFGLNDKGETK